LVKEALRDLIALQDKLITIENIQKTVAEYYKIKVSDLLSKRRSRVVTRPRQLAMSLAKELTNHSLPEIGEAFWRQRSYNSDARLPRNCRIERVSKQHQRRF